MKIHLARLLAASLAFLAANAPATVLYVDLNSPNPVSPYADWSTAATNIQNAINAANSGDVVLVTNGIYQYGGVVNSGSNRVYVLKPITVQSVNGPAVTIIQGYQVPGTTNGNNAVRCVYLTNAATLSGFTLINGATPLSSGFGGGVYCASTSCVVTNCVIVGNSAGSGGGGAYSGTLVNCSLIGNSATGSGGGALGGTLNNCLLAGNSAVSGGAVAVYLYFTPTILNNCTIYGNSASQSGGGLLSAGAGAPSYLFASNCIVMGNTAPTGSNYCFLSVSEMTFNYCCTAPLPTIGTDNISGDPQFVNPTGGDFHLQTNSPCINAGSSNAVGSVDLDGNPRIVGGFVDMGAYEYQLPAPVPVSPSIQATYTGVSTGIVVGFTGQITGHATVSRWDFGDGTVISNQLPSVSHSWTAPGDYVAALWAYNNSYPNGVSATVIIHVLENPMYYVSQNSTNPVAPFLSWDTAATNIQDAVDAAYVGGTVLVSNGVYATGGEVGGGNRVALMKQIAVRSINGPETTTVDGGGAVRCVYLTNNTTLAGFTLTNGATSGAGAGVTCASTNAVVYNCVITANSAGGQGGGTYSGTLENCSLVGNSAVNGGGAASATLNNCVLSNNVALQGGGAFQGIFNNCLFVDNSAPQGGGILVGSPNSTVLNNCTIYGNSASVEGGGIDSVWATANDSNLSAINCIIFGNNSPSGSNYYFAPGYDFELSFNYCCITPLPTTGLGNITNDPAFVDPLNGNFHLQSNSPCINSGNNAYVTTTNDLDGNPRIQGGTMDIGAYEFQSPVSRISYAWLQQYSLPINTNTDFSDADNDGMNNWQEWIAGTDPTNPLSVLKMLAPASTNNPSGLAVTWQSVITRTYYLQRSTDLTVQPAFSSIQSNIVGQAGTTSYTDTTATNNGPYFYRVGVQ